MIKNFCPGLIARCVWDITPEYLRDRGCRGIILDLDNTLVEWRGDAIDPAVTDWIDAMKAAGMKLCIASNTHRPRRLQRLAEIFGIPAVTGVAKPRRAGFRRAMEMLGTTREDTVMIGDQVMTDIWGGNRCGIFTILVQPLSGREFIGTKLVNRQMERWIMRRLEANGWLTHHQRTPAATEAALQAVKHEIASH